MVEGIYLRRALFGTEVRSVAQSRFGSKENGQSGNSSETTLSIPMRRSRVPGTTTPARARGCTPSARLNHSGIRTSSASTKRRENKACSESIFVLLHVLFIFILQRPNCTVKVGLLKRILKVHLHVK